MKNILKRIGLVFMILVMVATIGFTVFTGKQVADGLVYQNADKDTHDNSIKHLGTWDYDYTVFEEKYNIEYDFVTTKDYVYVPYSKITSDEVNEDKVIIMVHGAGGDRVSVYPQAELYLEEGYTVFAYDQRGCGESGDDKVTFGHYEKIDIETIVNKVKRNYPNSMVVVHGFSMGAVTTGLYATTEHALEHVDAVVLDSPFESMKAMFSMVWEDLNTGLPVDFALFSGSIMMQIEYGFNFEHANLLKESQYNQVPTLMIHSERDDLCSIETGKKIFEAISAQDKELFFLDSKHIEGYIDFPVEYKEKVMTFINKDRG